MHVNSDTHGNPPHRHHSQPYLHFHGIAASKHTITVSTSLDALTVLFWRVLFFCSHRACIVQFPTALRRRPHFCPRGPPPSPWHLSLQSSLKSHDHATLAHGLPTLAQCKSMICETLTLEEQAQLAVRHQPRQLSHLGVNEFVHTHIEHMRTRARARTHTHTHTHKHIHIHIHGQLEHVSDHLGLIGGLGPGHPLAQIEALHGHILLRGNDILLAIGICARSVHVSVTHKRAPLRQQS